MSVASNVRDEARTLREICSCSSSYERNGSGTGEARSGSRRLERAHSNAGSRGGATLRAARSTRRQEGGPEETGASAVPTVGEARLAGLPRTRGCWRRLVAKLLHLLCAAQKVKTGSKVCSSGFPCCRFRSAVSAQSCAAWSEAQARANCLYEPRPHLGDGVHNLHGCSPARHSNKKPSSEAASVRLRRGNQKAPQKSLPTEAVSPPAAHSAASKTHERIWQHQQRKQASY
eukprot:3523628-Pleurochrysis_carterae.AAC.1